MCSTAAGPKDFRENCKKLNIIRSTCYHFRVRPHVLLSSIQIACVLHLSLVKFQQEWSHGVHSGAVWRIRKNASDPVSKTATLRQKRGSP